MKRLFIAVPIDEKVRMQIVRGILHDVTLQKMPVRWTTFENLHLTMQFLGDVEEKRIAALRGIIDALPLPERDEYLEFTAAGAFPNRNEPRILWLGIRENRFLQLIRREMTTALQRQGFEADRKPFRPHLTLGRVKNNAVLPDGALDYLIQAAEKNAAGRSPLDRVTLFESRLRQSGPIYSKCYERIFRQEYSVS